MDTLLCACMQVAGGLCGWGEVACWNGGPPWQRAFPLLLLPHLAAMPALTNQPHAPAAAHDLLQLVVKTCHKRGCFAMGGMSAVIPIKGDEAANNVSAGWFARAVCMSPKVRVMYALPSD